MVFLFLVFSDAKNAWCICPCGSIHILLGHFIEAINVQWNCVSFSQATISHVLGHCCTCHVRQFSQSAGQHGRRILLHHILALDLLKCRLVASMIFDR